jgi:dihydroflavonol-4-reductase
MRIVVTGATGHVGCNLVRALVNQGHRVRALIHNATLGIEGLDIETVHGDVLDFDSLVRAFDSAETVYHLAGCISLSPADRPLLEAVNVQGVRNVVEACRRSGVRRLVHFSSIHAIKDVSEQVVDESCDLVDSSQAPPYDRSKAAGEREVLKGIEKGLDAIIISPTGVIGPHDYRPSHFGQALLYMAQGKLPALLEGGFNWVDVRDVVAATIQAEKQAPSGTKYLLSGHWVPVAEVGAMVAKITGVPAPGFVCPAWLALCGAPFLGIFDRLRGRQPLYTAMSIKSLQYHRHVSHEKATRELGYQPRPFRETLADTLQWFREAGMLSYTRKDEP